jgi:three-Cys-motif partner protein
VPRPIGEWTRDKLKILEAYLPGYLQATTRTVERIYIDGFAGPGSNRLDTGEIIDGSPLIAVKASAHNGTRFSRLFFIERDPANIAELRAALAEIGSNDRCVVLPGDVNVELPKLLQSLPPLSPIFVFLDPAGIDPAWDTVVSLATRRTELLINFPLGMSINRNAMRSPARMDAYFGTPEWRQVFSSPGTGRVRRILDFYKERLATLGYTHTIDDDKLVKTLHNQKLYYLMFVSKTEVARKIMDWVFKQPDSRGQQRLDL